MRTLIIAERQSLFDFVKNNTASAIKAGYGDVEDLSVLIVNSFTSLKPAYPRGLRWRDYPWTGDPDFVPSPNPWATGSMSRDGVWTVERSAWNDPPNAELSLTRMTRAASLIANADLIVSAYDADHSGQWMASWLLAGARHGTKILHLLLDSTADDDIGAEVAAVFSGEKAETNAERHRAFATSGAIKRRFDYAFNVNALAILSETFRRALGRDPAVSVSKFALQFLYHLADSGAMTEEKAFVALSQWTPLSPSRQAEKGMGSPASRGGMIARCVENGLIEVDAQPRRKMISLSADGRRFLASMHPDCRDHDLPFRLRDWMETPRDEAAVRIDRYVRTFFGKQIRFLARSNERTCLR